MEGKKINKGKNKPDEERNINKNGGVVLYIYTPEFFLCL